MSFSKIDKSSKKIPWLAGLFGIQVVVAVVLFNVQNRQPAASDEPLLAFNKATLDAIEITAGEENIALRKKGTQWQIDDDLPVVQTRVDDLLKEIEALRGGWAVAKTDEAAKRFEVAEEKFKRKIRLLSGDKEVGALLMGTSPAFRQSHVRKPGDANIYAVKLSEFSLATDKDSWIDMQLMRPEGDIVAVQSGGRKVEKVAGHWPANTPTVNTDAAAESSDGASVENAQASVETDQPQATTANTAPAFDSAAFTKALADLTVLGLAKNQADLDAPVTDDATEQDQNKVLKIEWTVTTDKGTYEYQLLSKSDQYYIRRGDNDHTFRLSKPQYDALAKIQDLRQS